MNFKSKFLTAAAAGALLISSFTTSAFAATNTIQITGNGSSSDNTANVDSSNSSTVVQNNNTDITNHINTTAKTGDNNASGNTGGNTTILTGDASSRVNVTNTANLNRANLSNCSCATTSNVTISGNGSDSDNTAKVNTNSDTSAFQTNQAHITNDINTTEKTGSNNASGNTSSTSGGMVTILTGNASSNTTLRNMANSNILTQGSGGGSSGHTTSVIISGNGSDSDNRVRLDLDNSAVVVQDNMAHFRNSVDDFMGTGLNNANGNTGADVLISTGNSSAVTRVDNLANFNAASLDCACLTDVMAKIAGNGSDSDNAIRADLDNTSSIFQGREGSGNNAHFSNFLDSFGKTGLNGASGNTDPRTGDPVRVFTGNSDSNTTVSNSGGVNIAGPSANITLPGGGSLELSFNLSDLLALLHS